MNNSDKKILIGIGLLTIIVGACIIADNIDGLNLKSNSSLKSEENKIEENVVSINEEQKEVGLIRKFIKSAGLNIKKFWKWIY